MNGQCSATRGEKRHPAPRIATAINMVMSSSAEVETTDRITFVAPSRSPGYKGWLKGLEETCTKVDADGEDMLDSEPWLRVQSWGCSATSGHRGSCPKSAFGTAGSRLRRAELRTSLHVCLRTCC